MSTHPTLNSEHEFYQYWGRVIATGKRITDPQLDSLLSSDIWPEAVNQALSQLAARMILTDKQTIRALDTAKAKYPDAFDAKRDLEALKILQDGLRGPMYKLQSALNLEADWAAVIAIHEVLPYYTNHARQMVIGSDRPNSVKSHLIKVINAHADEMRLVTDYKR